MGSKVLFLVMALCLAGIAVAVGMDGKESLLLTYVLVVLMAFVMAFLFRSVIKPKHTVMRGMALIAAQDFNNRLTKVGERDADRIVRLFNTMIDKLRGERLHNMEQEGFLKLLVDASPMGVAMLDFDGRFTMANGAFLKITGLGDENEIVGKRMEQLDFDLRRSMMRISPDSNEVIRRGDVRMYRCYRLSFVQSGFRREFYLLESLTEEVMKAERAAYEKVIRIISHEVNNTMGGVRSVLDTLCDVTDDEEIREVIESCDNRCEQMCGFISSYADVVKVPSPVIKPVDLVDDLWKLMPFLREMVRGDIKLEYTHDCGKIMADYDRMLMQQVVVNIVKNAAESIRGDEGRIMIHAGMEKGKPVLEVANNGMPISEEVAIQLFRPFFSTKKEGRGLGLTLVGEILNRHKAHFSLRTADDGLTRFRIELP